MSILTPDPATFVSFFSLDANEFTKMINGSHVKRVPYESVRSGADLAYTELLHNLQTVRMNEMMY